MRLTIHQPTFLPYLGFFRKIALADVFVVYDSAQYSRGDWHNRNKILSPNGPIWLTVPVSAPLDASFRDATLADTHFIQKHLASIRHAYSTAPFFSKIYPEIEKIYTTPAASLAEFNWNFLSYFLQILELSPRILYSSTIPGLSELRATDAIIAMARYAGATTYISGVDGPHYMDMDALAQAHLTIELNDFTPQPYTQHTSKTFVPYLSVLDALMNVGPTGVKKLIGI